MRRIDRIFKQLCNFQGSAMKDARSGKTKKHVTLESLMADLNADD
jgi:hypothetical protein